MEKEPTYKQTPDIMILQQHLAQFISPRKMFVSLSVWGTHMSHNHPEVCIIFQPPALHPSPNRGNLKQSLLQRHSRRVTWSWMKVVFHTSLHLYDIGYSKAPSAKLKPAQSQSGGGHRWAAKCDILKGDFQHKFSVKWTTKRMESSCFFSIESNVLAWMPSPVESLRTELDPRGQP